MNDTQNWQLIEHLLIGGFASCAMYYPNLNAQITPQFLSGREHFFRK
jgi:hypothetical protein